MILRTRGLKARAFHAGLETGVKTEIQNEFMKSADLVIVATIAFGMGIDKASIRNVVHFNIPNSLESYSQGQSLKYHIKFPLLTCCRNW